MAKRTRGGTNQFLGKRVVKFYTNGKRADNAYGLSEQVGFIVKRADAARRKAVVSVSRKAQPLARKLVLGAFKIRSRDLTGKVTVYDTGDTLHVNASVKKFPLALFAARWGGHSTAGATAEIRRGDPKTYAHAFIAKGRYLGQTTNLVYARDRTARKVRMAYGSHAGELRQPIRALRGPSVYDMLTSIERDTAAGKGGRGEYTRELRKFYVSELRRLYDVEARRNG